MDYLHPSEYRHISASKIVWRLCFVCYIKHTTGISVFSWPILTQFYYSLKIPTVFIFQALNLYIFWVLSWCCFYRIFIQMYADVCHICFVHSYFTVSTIHHCLNTQICLLSFVRQEEGPFSFDSYTHYSIINLLLGRAAYSN